MSSSFAEKVVLITGASSGMGKACAEHLSRQGYQVYGTSRHPEEEGTEFKLLRMDVNDPASVTAAVKQILDAEGHLDILVNNAGYGIAGAVEDTSMAEMQQQFETNYFGVFRVCREVLPHMRKQQSGLIINISSISGLIAVPFQAAYSASKYAVEGLTEALSMEVRTEGIRVVLIEPGDFQTGFTDNRIRTESSTTNPHYAQRCQRALQVMENDERNGSRPIKIARLLERIIQDPAPRLRYTTGPSMERLAVHLKKILPSRFFEWLMMRTYKISH